MSLCWSSQLTLNSMLSRLSLASSAPSSVSLRTYGSSCGGALRDTTFFQYRWLIGCRYELQSWRMNHAAMIHNTDPPPIRPKELVTKLSATTPELDAFRSLFDQPSPIATGDLCYGRRTRSGWTASVVLNDNRLDDEPVTRGATQMCVHLHLTQCLVNSNHSTIHEDPSSPM